MEKEVKENLLFILDQLKTNNNDIIDLLKRFDYLQKENEELRKELNWLKGRVEMLDATRGY